ncbi:hypothetical protein B2G86_11575 [Mammaliicoccus fleurettii]|nr:hypothetical protein B2G86_11575 [Mammaliicoccus fleurettii]
MKYKDFEQNRVFMIMNCIIFIIACLLIKKIPLFNTLGFFGIILFIIVILILGVVIYHINFFLFKKFEKFKN